MKIQTKIVALLVLFIYPLFGFPQYEGKSNDIFKLINEARVNPKAFLAKYKTKIEVYEPKFISLLKQSSQIEQVIWDEDLAKNCRQRVYGDLNPEYKGVNNICGSSSGRGSGYLDKDPLYFVCDSYTQILNEDYKYFAFYIDEKGHAFSWGKSCNTRKFVYEFKEAIDSSNVDFSKINTAIKEVGLTAMDKEMIKEINFARQYPKVYASIVAKYLAEESKSLRGLSKDKYDAGIELINELIVMSPAQLLYPKECVHQAAKKHGEDCKSRGYTDHTGSDGSSPFSRISKFCTGLSGNENIVGGRKNARILVIQLLIDSGISSRGHRYNMLNPDWQYIGCYGYAGNGIYNYVQNFAMN